MSLQAASEYIIDRFAFTLTSFDWDYRNSANTAQRLAIQIGSSWYASQVVGTGNANWLVASVNMATATWSDLNFTPGTTLSLGSATTLPSTGNITSFGVFASSAGNETSRIDGFTVNAVPEPSAAAITCLGILGLLVRRGRRA